MGQQMSLSVICWTNGLTYHSTGHKTDLIRSPLLYHKVENKDDLVRCLPTAKILSETYSPLVEDLVRTTSI